MDNSSQEQLMMSVSEAHPFYPLDAEIPHYVPNTHGPVVLLTIFSACTGVFCFLASRLLAMAGVRGKDNFAAVWFAFCGFLHIFFEGYVIINHETVASSNMIFCQLMKVYALSDTRYILSDPFVVSIEGITVVVWGSLSVITVFAIIARSHAMRHMLQIVISVAHIYGLTLYFVTHLAEKHLRGIEYTRPEPFYFWAYCVGANLPWYFAPMYLMKDTYDQMVKAFRTLGDRERKNI